MKLVNIYITHISILSFGGKGIEDLLSYQLSSIQYSIITYSFILNLYVL